MTYQFKLFIPDKVKRRPAYLVSPMVSVYKNGTIGLNVSALSYFGNGCVDIFVDEEAGVGLVSPGTYFNICKMTVRNSARPRGSICCAGLIKRFKLEPGKRKTEFFLEGKAHGLLFNLTPEW